MLISPRTPFGRDLSNQRAYWAADPGEVVAPEPVDYLAEQCGRLMLRLLAKYLQSAAPKPAEAASNNAIHLLQYLAHPERPTSR